MQALGWRCPCLGVCSKSPTAPAPAGLAWGLVWSPPQIEHSCREDRAGLAAPLHFPGTVTVVCGCICPLQAPSPCRNQG